MSSNSSNRNNNTRNLVKYRSKPKSAVIILGIIVVYVVVFVSLYISKSKTRTYEVYAGTLTANSTFTGIALRNEQVYNASSSGNIDYYVREGSRVKVDDTIYTVDETGRVSSMLAELNKGSNSLSEANLDVIKTTLNSFKVNYNVNDFNKVYDLKSDISTTVLQSINSNIMENLDELISSTGTENLFKTINSDKTGIVVYSIDGYESTKAQDIKKSNFDANTYSKKNLKAESLVVSDNPAYKLVTGENWDIVIPVTQDDINTYDLNNKKSIKIRFIKDNVETTANFALFTNDGQTYGKLSLDKYLIRYVTDRFLQIELITSNVSGLKIPVSAIVEKDFYTVPIDYLTTGGNTNNKGFIWEHYNSSNEIVREFITPNIIATDEQYVYIDPESVNAGDILIKTDSNQKYNIGPKKSLQGAYCVNTGYTIFRRIEIVDQNKEYYIIKKGTYRGLSVYDHIILDSSKTVENQMIY